MSGTFENLGAVAVDDDGAALVARGPGAVFPRSDTPTVVERFDAHGAPRWRWSPTTDEAFVFTDATIDANGNAVIVGLRGGGQGDRWKGRGLIVRLDPDGRELPLAGFEERRQIHHVKPLRSGGLVYLAERWSLVMLDPSGRERWRRDFDRQAISPRAITVDDAEDVFVVGYLTNTTDLGGGPLTATLGIEAQDAFAVAYDATGQHLWSRRFGDGDQGFMRAASDPQGNLVVLGANGGTIDLGGGPITRTGAVLASFEREGAHRWSRALHANEPYSARVLGVDGSGAITVGGAFNGTLDLGAGPMVSAGREDLFLARLDTAGHLQATWRFGGPGGEGLGRIAMSPRGFAVLLGGYTAPFDLGCGALPAPPRGWAWFAAVLAP